MISKSISAVVGLGFLAMSSAQAATVTLTPSDSRPNSGDAFTILVEGSDFGTPTSGANLIVAFDPAVLTLTGASLSAGSSFDDILFDSASSEVNFFTFDVAGVGGAFEAIDLSFTALNNSPTTVSLIDQGTSLIGWFDNNADPILGINYNSAEVNPVPLPAAIWMMLGGMGLLGWTGRRRS